MRWFKRPIPGVFRGCSVAEALEARVGLAARATLRHITPADGYRTRPRGAMGAGVQPPNPLTAPTILVHEAEGSQGERIVHQPPMWEHRIPFAVECWTVGAGEDG